MQIILFEFKIDISFFYYSPTEMADFISISALHTNCSTVCYKIIIHDHLYHIPDLGLYQQFKVVVVFYEVIQKFKILIKFIFVHTLLVANKSMDK